MLQVKKDRILFGNGASELFPAILHGLKPERVLLPVPGYSGYERAADASGAKIRYYEMAEETGFCLKEPFLDALSGEIDLLFLTNPNNPVGNCICAELLEKIVRRCREKNIAVVLDECFLEFTDGEEERSYIGRLEEFPNLMIVRAFTKFFSLPGVRLGYLLTENKEYLERIALQLPEWNVSVFAQEGGVAAVKERAYYKGAVGLIREERTFLLHELERMGIRVYPSDANFILFYTEKPLRERLLERGMMIRDLRDCKGLSPGYYRIGLRRRFEHEKLLEAMRNILQE